MLGQLIWMHKICTVYIFGFNLNPGQFMWKSFCQLKRCFITALLGEQEVWQCFPWWPVGCHGQCKYYIPPLLQHSCSIDMLICSNCAIFLPFKQHSYTLYNISFLYRHFFSYTAFLLFCTTLLCLVQHSYSSYHTSTPYIAFVFFVTHSIPCTTLIII